MLPFTEKISFMWCMFCFMLDIYSNRKQDQKNLQQLNYKWIEKLAY